MTPEQLTPEQLTPEQEKWRQAVISLRKKTNGTKTNVNKVIKESDVQKKLLGELNELGIFIKPLVTGCVGFPDIVGSILCTNKEGQRIGVACFVEVKRTDGKASKAQLHWLSKLAETGAVTAICQGDVAETLNIIRLQLHQRGFKAIKSY